MDEFEEDVDYAVLEELEEGMPSPIRILRKPFEDVIIMYGKVKLQERIFGAPTLSFTYQILESGQYTKETLKKSIKFKEFLGDLLRDIIINANEVGTSDFKEPDQQRRILEKSSSVS